MTPNEQKAAAKQFIANWTGRGDEKQETQSFWIELLRTVYGVESPEQYISFEVPVKLSHTSFIDGYLDATRVLIEQKGADIDLRKGYKQSDGSLLTPFQQARRYAGYLPHDKNPRWIVVCNFKEFHIHDMNRPNDAPEIVLLSDLEKDYPRLQFLVDTGNSHIQQEMEISIKAGEVVGLLYDAFLKQYKDPENAETLKSLNKLCVRLVFCLYAEDAGIFGKHLMFHDYLSQYDAKGARKALRELFKILNQKPEERDPYLADDDPLLAAFPYVNGGLFADDDIEIPPFTDEIMDLILTKASADFDWSDISPTIFGAVFESTLNPETRRSGGMHYTSIENIHKVIDPLFLDDLKAEFQQISELNVLKSKRAALEKYQDKLASICCLDPAAGSGNFLTESYIALRRLENRVIEALIASEKGSQEGQIVMGDLYNPIKVSIGQFYGIEINDFAVTVALTALWIAESQMMQETEAIIHMSLDFLPLKTHAHIVEGNALRIDWEDVVPKDRLNYIMGNPPFVGHQWRSKAQADDMTAVFYDLKKYGKLDYVTAWYQKAADYMQGTRIETAFVSTNSISQGESVGILWAHLFDVKNVEIQFAYRTFVWVSEAKDRAAVHCVIVGFSCFHKDSLKLLVDGASRKEVSHINGYLLNAPDVFIQSRGKQLTKGYPEMSKGSQPTDGGYLLLSSEDKAEMISKHPVTERFIRRFVGSRDLINAEYRYCLWLKGVAPSEYRTIKPIMDRLEMVAETRKNSPTASVRADASKPMLFTQIRQPETDYLAVPEVSSQNRRYIPISFLSPEIIASNKLYLVPQANLYMFGVMMSNVHMAWMRVVCGRLKSDYSYSPAVYNNFPWPTPTDAQKVQIEKTAQAILDARALYPDASLADLYDELTMPPELRTAHQNNDRAVMRAYGFDIATTTEASCVAELMKMYQEMTT